MADETPSSNGKSKQEPAKRSAVEKIKEESRHLRGTIALELLKDTDRFVEQDKQLLKFHGSYQQEDRDARKNRSKAGVGKHYMVMVRCKIPGGQLTARQYLAIDDIAGKYGNATLRLTARQGIQLHGILKGHLHDTIAGINACLLTTLGACGDVSRNVMACPAPHRQDGTHARLQETARAIALHLAPRSRAYHEIWLNGKELTPIEDLKSKVEDVEPIYGKLYLPRKFKIGLAFPDDNCIDVYAQDLGLLAIVESGNITGYNVLVGGGMGMTHGNPNTFPYTAKPICHVPADSVLEAAEAVIRLFRDHGNRADRKRARIKYLVHDWGIERFREVLASYLPFAMVPPRPIEVRGYDLHLGWREQGDGKWYYGLSIENGRIKDDGPFQLRSALRRLVEELQPSLRLTPAQDLLLCGLPESARTRIESTLAEHGVLASEKISMVQKLGMACPAIPTCGLAISESERVLPGIIDHLELELKNLGLADEPIAVRMTGCPNGCARPFQSDIGIVGRSGDKYTIYLGGRLLGDRLNFQFKDLVPEKDVVPLLIGLLRSFKRHRQNREPFGDYCQRLGRDGLLQELASQPPADDAAVTVA
jgi:sulfite reductase (ferredoxin)